METLKEIWREAKELTKAFGKKTKIISVDLWGRLKGESYYQMVCIVLALQILTFILCCFPAVKIGALMVSEEMSVMAWLQENQALFFITLGIQIAALVTVGLVFGEKGIHKKRSFVIAKLSIPYMAFWLLLLIWDAYDNASNYKSLGIKCQVTFGAVLTFILLAVLFVMLFVISSKSKKLSAAQVSECGESDEGSTESKEEKEGVEK